MARIEPLQKPYPPEFSAQMETIMRGAEPLALFTTLARSDRAWSKFLGGSLPGGRSSPLSLRQREVLIQRTVAKCGNEYEWGVHAATFAAAAGLDDRQLHATVHGTADDPVWSDEERALIGTVDALLADKRLSDEQWARARAHFDENQMIEIVQLVGFYHGVSLICGGLDLPLEPHAARFPAA